MISKAELRRRYLTLRQSSEAIGRELGVTGRTVRYWLKRIGLGAAMRRRKAEANIGRKPANYGRHGEQFRLGRRYVTRNGKVVPYARWLMEQHLGRTLDGQKEIVHHIDGNKLNDVITNLTIMTQAQHIKLHKPRSKRNTKRG